MQTHSSTEPPGPSATRFRGRACPMCSGNTERVARRFLDRLLSLFMPVSRYRCRSAACTWEGALRPRHSMPPSPPAAAQPRRQRLEASRQAGSANGTLKAGRGAE